MTLEIPFKAGRLKQFTPQWKELTSDSFIPTLVKGAKIPLEELPREDRQKIKNQVQGNLWKETDREIAKLLSMGVIEKSDHEEIEVVSPIFLVFNECFV